MSSGFSPQRSAHEGGIPIERRALAETKRIVLAVVGDTPLAVYLFGSRVRGCPRRFSDIDVALDNHGRSVPAALKSELNERLEDSTIPYRVDLVDLAELPAAAVARVRAEGIAWKG